MTEGLTSRFRYRFLVGVLLGLVASGAALPLFDGPNVDAAKRPSVALVSDCDGSLNQLVIHYVPEAADVVVPVYRDFLGHLPPHVTVRVVCSHRRDFDQLVAAIGACQCTLSPVVVNHPITCWSRDRWLALGPTDDDEAPTTILSPRGEEGASIWAARKGDEEVGRDLSNQFGPKVEAVRSELFFDGGDFVSDARTVFLTPAVLRRNFQRTVNSEAELVEILTKRLGRRVVLLEDAPEHHAGMFMMTVGAGTVVVGDPATAHQLLSAHGAEEQINGLLPTAGPDFSPATQARFDAVAAQCHADGYNVIRIPIVPGRDGRTYLSYLNVILDDRDNRRIVYLPVFRDVEVLNEAAERVWKSLGYEVCRVDCTDCYPHFGTLRCLVNVLRRDSV